jgi:hypothetical protein
MDFRYPKKTPEGATNSAAIPLPGGRNSAARMSHAIASKALIRSRLLTDLDDLKMPKREIPL